MWIDLYFGRYGVIWYSIIVCCFWYICCIGDYNIGVCVFSNSVRLFRDWIIVVDMISVV